jgi:endonuclease III
MPTKKKTPYIYHKSFPLPEVLDILDATYDKHPMGDLTAGNAFKTLVSCIISLRTKDEVTIPASERLFAVADTPEAMRRMSQAQMEALIYPAGFYRNKAAQILNACAVICDDFGGVVPNTIEELITLKGVGRKTANLVVGLGHLEPAICVDIHVHRICNRMGAVTSTQPDHTEFALRRGLDVVYWDKINTLMVAHGRECCKPIGARCDVCPVEHLCKQRDVKMRKPPRS